MSEFDAFRAAVREQIEANGWHVVLIEAEDGRPAYGFTLGLVERFGHPELCVIGLDDGEEGGLMHELLDSAAEFVAEGGKLVVGVRNTELFVGHSVGVRAIGQAQAADWLALGTAVLGQGEFPALQLLWPDRRGRLPFEPQCEKKVVEAQPLLGG